MREGDGNASTATEINQMQELQAGCSGGHRCSPAPTTDRQFITDLNGSRLDQCQAGFASPCLIKKTSPPFLLARALTDPAGPNQFCLYPQLPASSPCLLHLPEHQQVSSVPLMMETSSSTMNAANTWLPTISKGMKKRSLVQFLFTVLYSCRMASSDCLQQAGRFFFSP